MSDSAGCGGAVDLPRRRHSTWVADQIGCTPPAPHPVGVPRPWVPPHGDGTRPSGADESVENEGELAVRNTGAERHSDDQRLPVQWSVRRSIRPGAPVPDTVLVAEMSDGSLFLHGWRDGPSAYILAEDAGPLRRELAAAFGSAGATGRGVPGEPL